MPKPATVRLYIGTYTTHGSRGIYRLQLEVATGALAAEDEPTETANPSYLALHPNRRFLYAVNELGESRHGPGGAVSAFAIDPPTGALTFLGRQPSGGAAPCHLSLDAQGGHLLVANYWSGSVGVLPVRADGALAPATATVQHEGRSVNPERQEGPHAHSINLDPTGRFAFAADLGLDEIRVYRFDRSTGSLLPHDPSAARVAPGSGPRHLAFHPDGRHAYVINELSSTITAFGYDAAKGTLAELQTISTLPAAFRGSNTTAEVAVRADGRFLYGSNRGHDSIAIFAIDASTGRLTGLGHQPTLGKTPRHFAIDPTGTWLLAANQDSDDVVVFRVDAASARLEPAGHPTSVPRPVCIRMVVPD